LSRKSRSMLCVPTGPRLISAPLPKSAELPIGAGCCARARELVMVNAVARTITLSLMLLGFLLLEREQRIEVLGSICAEAALRSSIVRAALRRTIPRGGSLPGGSPGAPQQMKMGTIASPWRYDVVACCAIQSLTLRSSTISCYAASGCFPGRPRPCQREAAYLAERPTFLARSSSLSASFSKSSAILPYCVRASASVNRSALARNSSAWSR
jgi:hypothetical protein